MVVSFYYVKCSLVLSFPSISIFFKTFVVILIASVCELSMYLQTKKEISLVLKYIRLKFEIKMYIVYSKLALYNSITYEKIINQQYATYKDATDLRKVID